MPSFQSNLHTYSNPEMKPSLKKAPVELFIHFRELDMTGTFKLKKRELQVQWLTYLFRAQTE